MPSCVEYCVEACFLLGAVWLCISRHLETRVFADSQAAHPHVCQQHLAAGVSDEVSLLGSHGQLQAGGVAPVDELVGEQLHGHLLVVLVGLIQQFVGQLAKLSAGEDGVNQDVVNRSYRN